MSVRTLFMTAALAVFLPLAARADGETFYVNPETGADSNDGTKGRPFKTLFRAAERVNEGKEPGPTTVLLSPGIYSIDRGISLKPGREYTKEDRLTIQAEVLPDDPAWDPSKMPTLIHTMPLAKFGFTFGIHVETSHVTIRGLKILGIPVVETPKPKVLNRVYPILRMNPKLDDLEIAQCLFAGDKVTNPNHLGILTNGNGVNVHHCVFHAVKLTVVYWTPGSKGHSMTNCFVDGAYGSGVWTTEVADDFVFRNNVIANGDYIWTYQSGAIARRDPDAGKGKAKSEAAPEKGPVHYKVVDSLFAGNKRMACSGTGANLEFKDIDASFLELVGTKVSPETVAVEYDEAKRDYLHPVAGSEAAKVGVGLFIKKAGE